jgi:HK97 family phage major capsid protein
MTPKIKRLRDRQAAVVKTLDEMLATCTTQDRELNADEKARYSAGKAELDDIAAALKKQDDLAEYHRAVEPLAIDGPDPSMSYFDRPQGNIAGEPTGMVFKNAATGATIRALRRGEPFCQQPPGDGEPNYLGRTVAAWLTGRPDLAASAQQGNVTTAGGYLFEPQMSQMFIDLARSASVCLRAGAQTIPMETAEMHLARLTTDPVSHWRGEAVNVPVTTAVFGRYILKARTLAAIVPITYELLEDAANAPSLIEQALGASLGLRLDQAALAGTGAESEPLGIRNTPNVGTITSVGTPAGYAKITTAVQQILTANYNGPVSGLSWILHPRDGGTYDSLTDDLTEPLRPTPWASQLQRLYTTSVSVAEGDGKNESYSVIGDFSQLLFGMRTSGIQLRRINAGQVADATGGTFNAPAQLMEFLVAYLRADVCVMRPGWFSVMSGVTAGAE